MGEDSGEPQRRERRIIHLTCHVTYFAIGSQRKESPQRREWKRRDCSMRSNQSKSGFFIWSSRAGIHGVVFKAMHYGRVMLWRFWNRWRFDYHRARVVISPSSLPASTGSLSTLDRFSLPIYKKVGNFQQANLDLYRESLLVYLSTVWLWIEFLETGIHASVNRPIYLSG